MPRRAASARWARRRRSRASSRRCAPSPGSSTRRFMRWPRSETRARPRRCSSCSMTSSSRPPPSRPSGALPIATPCLASPLTSSTPTRPSETRPFARWSRSSSGRRPWGRASTRRFRPRCGARSSSHTSSSCSQTRRHATAAPPPSHSAGSARAGRPALSSSCSPTPSCRSSRATPSFRSASRSARHGRRPLPTPMTRFGWGRRGVSRGSPRRRGQGSWRPSSTTRQPRCVPRRLPRSAGWATRMRRCCCSSCSATRAS